MSGELQTIVAARSLIGKRSCFIGVGRPSTAAILARMIHNPELVLVYESGTIGAKPHRIPLSIGDGELAETADFVVSVPEMFNYWIQPGRVQVAFLGAAQVDRHANLNSTVIGDYAHPKTRLPGAGGAPEIATGCAEVVVIAPHSPRTFVERLDFRTTTGGRTTAVITDLGVLEPDGGELTLTQLHPGVSVEQVREQTGWDTLRVADELARHAGADRARSSTRSRSCSPDERGLRLRRRPHAVRPLRRRRCRACGPTTWRPTSSARSSSARPRSSPSGSTTSCSATPTARARTTATSRAWPCCSPGSRRASPAPRSTGCAARRSTRRCRRPAPSRRATRR